MPNKAPSNAPIHTTRSSTARSVPSSRSRQYAVHDPAINMGFFRVDAEVIDAWEAAGLDFYRMGKDRVRLVTSFRSTPAEIDEAIRRMAATPHRNSPDEAAPAQ